MNDNNPGPEEDGKNLAVASLVLSILSIIIGGPIFPSSGAILAIPGVILGHGARRKLRNSPSAVIAQAGLIVGYANIFRFVTLFAWAAFEFFKDPAAFSF